jgi:hypothetical protein
LNSSPGVRHLKNAQWYFVDTRDRKVKAVIPAEKLSDIPPHMGCSMEELKIVEANWNGKEFIKGKVVKGYG